MDNKIKESILSKVVEKEGKKYIDCSESFAIANKFGMAPIEVGKICNEMKIKIMNCQLGCF
jgi:uncharacterized membrane-anchored protein